MALTNSQHAKLHKPESDPNPCENCGTPTYNSRFCSHKCSHFVQRRTEHPTKAQLQEDIANLSWSAMGRKYGVSDNAVRKWAKRHGLL
jgi:hypothetical protein